MQTNNFRVTVVEEHDVVEICGALKVNLQNYVGLLAGNGAFEQQWNGTALKSGGKKSVLFLLQLLEI